MFLIYFCGGGVVPDSAAGEGAQRGGASEAGENTAGGIWTDDSLFPLLVRQEMREGRMES